MVDGTYTGGVYREIVGLRKHENARLLRERARPPSQHHPSRGGVLQRLGPSFCCLHGRRENVDVAAETCSPLAYVLQMLM